MKSKHANKSIKKTEHSNHIAGYNFPGASKDEQYILQELAGILEDIPEETLQESVLTHVRSYGIVRDGFLAHVHLHSYDIKANRELFSYEEKKQFNGTLALALEYLTDSNQQLFSKKEFQRVFGIQEKGYKLYSAMITILQRHDVQTHANIGPHTLSAALEGARLFFKKRASFVREEIQRLAYGYQQEISHVFAG